MEPRHSPYRVVLFTIAVVTGLRLAPQLTPLLYAIVFTVCFALALEAPVGALARRGVPRGLGVALVLGAGAATAVVALVLAGPAALDEVERLRDDHGDLKVAFAERVDELLHRVGLPPVQLDERDGGDLVGRVLEFRAVRDTGSLVGIGAVALFAASWAVVNPQVLNRRLRSFVPPRHRAQVSEVAGAVAERLRRWLIGQAILNLFVAVATFGLLTVLGVPFSFVFALIAGLFETVPTLGMLIAAAGPAAMVLLEDPSKLPWLIVGILIIQQVQDRLVSPAVMGRAVDIPQTILLLVMMAAGLLLGPLGLVVAVPLTATFFTVHDELVSYDEAHPSGSSEPCP